MSESDPYRRLRDATPVPDDEVCRCDNHPPLVLRSILTANPIGCSECNGAITPEAIGFPVELAEELACWNDVSNSIDLLWLDSAEYEEWAQEQLNDPESAVNRRGLVAARELSTFRPCYYYLGSHRRHDEPSVGRETCPFCSTPLEGRAFLGLKCERCQVIYEV